MSFESRSITVVVVKCDGCGVEDHAVSDGEEMYAPERWQTRRTAAAQEFHFCSGRCRQVYDERESAAAVAR
jgi:hypothetical protein